MTTQVTTQVGPAIIVMRQVAILTSDKVGTTGQIALALLLDRNGKPSNYILVWEWGGDWMGFVDGDEHNAEVLDGWEPDAIREAVNTICAALKAEDVAEDLGWFVDWADAHEQTLEADACEPSQ
jgi:hypothetical protein